MKSIKEGKVSYHQQVSYCGKERCRKCREGTGHGPYWYAYKTVDGYTTRSYVGKNLPPDALLTMEAPLAPVEASAQEQIRIYTLGQFRLERRAGQGASAWQTITDAAMQHQRVRGLLSCLVSYSGSGARQFGREQIMDALWPDLSMENASNRLDRAVYSLRQVFEPDRTRPATSPFLLTERELLSLADQSQVWIDADAFEHLLAKARVCKETDPGKAEKFLDEAAMLYGGAFLPEEHKIEWTLARRESLTQSWVGALLTLSDLRATRLDLSSAVDPLNALLTSDPTNEAAVQRVMRLLKHLGRRSEALRVYKRLVAALKAEYGIAPLPETRALYDALRSGSDTTTRTVQGNEAMTPGVRRGDEPVIQIGRRHQCPLVGREQELHHLCQMLTEIELHARFRPKATKKAMTGVFDTEQRSPQSLLLMGRVGIGKTRLAEEVSREAKRRKWIVTWGRVYIQESGIAYRLWTEVLRKAMEQGVWQRQELSRRPLVFQPLCGLLPELQEFLPDVDLSSLQSPQHEQLRLWEATRQLLLLIAESTPLLIALDDLQWADTSSCDLFAYLARRVMGHPITIVGTCRDHDLSDDHPLKRLLTDLLRERVVETISLPSLSDEQISTLVTHSLHVEQGREPLVERISTRAAGNPFFAEELARTIAVQLSTQDANGTNGHTPATASNDTKSVLPDTISAVLDLRLSHLSPACARLLTKAAVLGGSFEFRVITEMEASVADEDVVVELLEEALKAGMLTEEGTGIRATYRFWHPLLISHLDGKLSAGRRVSLHRRAAGIFERMYRGNAEDGAAIITHHLVQAGAAPSAIARFAELAGNLAYRLSSYPDAERYYRIAMEHAGDEHLEHSAYLCELLGECSYVQGRKEGAERLYRRALEIYEQTSPQSPDVAVNVQLQALLLCEIGTIWRDLGKYAAARACYAQGEQRLLEAKLEASCGFAKIRHEQGHLCMLGGDDQEALRLVSSALHVFESMKQEPLSSPTSLIRRTLAGDPINIGRAYWLLGMICGNAGNPTASLAHFEQARAIFERLGVSRYIAIINNDLADLYLKTSQYKLVEGCVHRSLEIASRMGHLTLQSLGHGNLGERDLRLGNLAAAEAQLRKGIALAEKGNDSPNASLWSSRLAITLADLGRFSDARACAFSALKLSRAFHCQPYLAIALLALASLRIAVMGEQNNGISEAHVLRVKNTLLHALRCAGIFAETAAEGRLLLAQVHGMQGDVDDAQREGREVLEQARESSCLWLEASAQRLLGQINASQQQFIEAAQCFEAALKIFRKCGMRLEEARTKHLYGEMLVQEGKDSERGVKYLQEARQVFVNCKAEMDVKLVERALERCGVAVRR